MHRFVIFHAIESLSPRCYHPHQCCVDDALPAAGLSHHGHPSGIAYSMGPSWPEPKTIQHWPGKMLNELSNKVPTRLQYNESTGEVVKWGFQLSNEDDVDVKDYFKLHLDPSYPDPRPEAHKVEDARRWFRDYLRCVYSHIRETFNDSFPRWGAQRTEFVFSVPTTWKNPRMIADTEAIIRSAGFGTDGPEHRVVIGLTEAEAAAVYASRQQFEVGFGCLMVFWLSCRADVVGRRMT